MARGGVSFELERFGWTGGGAALEVAGRWRAARPRRLGAATLAVEVGGRRRLTPIVVTGDVPADPEPVLWRAEYRWPGGSVGAFELEVGSNLVIELPAPEGIPPSDERSEPSGAHLVRAELEAAHRQIEASRAETERLRDELVVLRSAAFERDQTKQFLRLAQATAEAERKAVRVAREQSAARRAAALDAGEHPSTAAESARAESAALRSELERFREEAAAVLAEADRARDELVEVRAGAGAARDEALERERMLERERDAAAEESRQLRDRLAAVQDGPGDLPAPTIERGDSNPDAVTTAVPAAAPGPVPGPDSSGERFENGPPTQVVEDSSSDTLVLDGPRRRPPVHQHRPRVSVVPQHTPSAPRRYAERPPKDSPALRAIAGVLLLLLVIVLVAVLVIVV
ncbi:MAG: hypothetical protein H0V26_13465 [Solirubrobacterales bacterium]|nr:hypothetical protein [Solirubrobacterales bacterium]